MQCKTANKCFLALQRSVQNIQLQPNQDFITTSYSVFIEGYKSKQLHWKRWGQDRTQVSWISSCFWRQPFLSTSDSSCFPLRSILAKTSSLLVAGCEFSPTSSHCDNFRQQAEEVRIVLAKWNQSKDKDLEPKVSFKKTTRERGENVKKWNLRETVLSGRFFFQGWSCRSTSPDR